MPIIRTLLRYLANNEKLVQRLSDSFPIRRAAQLTIALYYKSQEQLARLDPNTLLRFKEIFNKYASGFKKTIEDSKRHMKK